jgi:hypothetical protein
MAFTVSLPMPPEGHHSLEWRCENRPPRRGDWGFRIPMWGIRTKPQSEPEMVLGRILK